MNCNLQTQGKVSFEVPTSLLKDSSDKHIGMEITSLILRDDGK